MNQTDFWQAGLRVFGLLGSHDHDGIELDEKEKFKKPYSKSWQHTPDWSDEQFDTMHEMGQFDTGYGVLVYGLLVIDVDARNGGVASFEKLCEDLNLDLLGLSGLAVRTGSGGGSMHLYFKVPDDGSALAQTHKDYVGIDFKTSGYVVGPSSMHASGSVYEVMHGHPDDIESAPVQLLQLLKKPDHHRTEFNGEPLDITESDIRAMLEYYQNADVDYEEWIRVGMAIHDATCGNGFDIWDDWSKSSKKYDPSFMHRKWHSFGKGSSLVTIATIIHHAKQNGWRSSYDGVTFETNLVDDEIGLDTCGVDLKRPPGFVGELAQWINSQCFYPRENLAVAAALNAVGSIGGIKHADALNGFSANLYSLCVAGSSTGKEAVQQCYNACLNAAGIGDAMHGSIKSEQEMMRNFIRHQAAYYVIDEFGIFLRKLVNSGSKSGATYLEGVIGLAMSAYSKANDYLPISGDLKEFIRTELQKEAANCNKAIDNNEDKNGRHSKRLEQIYKQLDSLKRGIKNPYVTLMGFTTPVTFNELVSYEMATNGFISRAMIFDEPETNPKPNKRYKGGGMPSGIESRLAALYSMGDYDAEITRVEWHGDKVKIDSDTQARELLTLVAQSFWNMAESAKDNGLEAIPRRGYELVAKISFILAIPEGIRTAEHVRWAYALVKSDIERKMRLAFSNMQKDDDPASSIAAKIQTLLSDNPDGLTKGILINRCRPAKKEAVEKVLSELISRNLIFDEQTKKTSKYTLNRH